MTRADALLLIAASGPAPRAPQTWLYQAGRIRGVVLYMEDARATQLTRDDRAKLAAILREAADFLDPRAPGGANGR